ncbi:MAG: hypothetical protein OXN17_16880 [Candidatus Poribacteria bacterium]|nr:hypothetical protein [Candidatus Poribacteria bacterium]MDE0504769.1 hypothetical protein [Candidatus Poribacteria bacterium]
MYTRTRFMIRMPIYIACFTYIMMFGYLNFVRGEVESQANSPRTAVTRSQVQILQVGEFFYEISADPNKVWMGLFPTKEGYSLMPSEIRIDAFYNPTIGGDENMTGATRVSVHGDNPPLFLITGLESLRAGMVKTLFAGRLPLPPESLLEFTLDNENPYSITALGGMESNAGGVDHRVELVKGSRSQVICSFARTDVAVTYLLWAGDLDRDGQLDMLIDTVCDYNASGPMLLLSSFAEDGDLLQMVAQFETSPALVLN